MSWEKTLSRILDLGEPINKAVEGGQITWENAFTHPAITELREALIQELTGEGKIEELLEASKHLRAEHQKLLKKPDLSAADLTRLGVLSATAHTLSAEALARASSSRAIFLYTLQQLLPWLKRAASLAILISSSAGRNIGSDGALGPAIQVTADPSALEKAAVDLAATNHLLAQYLVRRGRGA